MKIKDIEFGVEYCYTGPLSYGNEPDVPRPDKVRFKDRRTGWGHLYQIVLEEVPSRTNGRPPRRRWTRTKHLGVAHRDEISGFAMQGDYLPVPGDSDKAGTEREWFMPVRAQLMGQRWNRLSNEWQDELVNPAGVHRTWAEHEANERDSAARAEERRIAAAPGNIDRAITELVKNAHLINRTFGEVLDALEEEWGK